MTYLKIRCMTHDHAPCTSSLEHVVYDLTDLLLWLECPAAVPQRAVRAIESVLSLCRIMRKTRVWMWWMRKRNRFLMLEFV